MSILEYIKENHPSLELELYNYIMSDIFNEDVERILSNDNTITRSFAEECACDQMAEELIYEKE